MEQSRQRVTRKLKEQHAVSDSICQTVDVPSIHFGGFCLGFFNAMQFPLRIWRVTIIASSDSDGAVSITAVPVPVQDHPESQD